MIKKGKKYIFIAFFITIIFVLILLCCGKNNTNNYVSSTENNSKNSLFESFLVYTGDDDKHWDAHYLKVDLVGYEIRMDNEIAFSIFDENEWSDNLFPIQMNNKQIILRDKPDETLNSNIEVSENDNQIWSGTNHLKYDKTKKHAAIYEDKRLLGIIEGLEYKGYTLKVLSFFIDSDSKLILACSLYPEEVEMIELNEIPLIILSAKNNEGQYIIEASQVVSNLYNEDLSILQLPNQNQILPNIYANPLREKFYWREGRSIVEIDPYSGSFRIVLRWDDIMKMFGKSKHSSEGYNRFVQYGSYNDINIVCFEDNDNGEGIRACFFDNTSRILCSVLVNTGLITIYNKDNQIMNQLEIDNLKPVVYIGVQY